MLPVVPIVDHVPISIFLVPTFPSTSFRNSSIRPATSQSQHSNRNSFPPPELVSTSAVEFLLVVVPFVVVRRQGYSVVVVVVVADGCGRGCQCHCHCCGCRHRSAAAAVVVVVVVVVNTDYPPRPHRYYCCSMRMDSFSGEKKEYQ